MITYEAAKARWPEATANQVETLRKLSQEASLAAADRQYVILLETKTRRREERRRS